MATIKAFTDISQSKKLAEFLPIESADMFYWCADHYPKEDWIIEVGTLDDNYECICAWSLAALLGVLPEGVIENYYTPNIQKENGKYSIAYGNEELLCVADNPIDACVEMILKLNELNLL